MIRLVGQWERRVYCTSCATVFLRVEDLENPSFLWRLLTGIVPLLIIVVRQVCYLVPRPMFAIQVIFVSFLQFLVLGYVAILAGSGRRQISNYSAEVFLVERAIIAERKGVSSDLLAKRLPGIVDAPSLLGPTIAFLISKIEV